MIDPTAVFETLDEKTRGPDDWYELIVEASADGIWFWDIDRGTVHWTSHLMKLLGLSPKSKSLSSKEALALIHTEDRERYKQAITTYLKGGADLFEIEVRLRNDQEGVRWILNRGIARRDEKGYAYCILGSVVDVTRRRRLEESLRAVALSASEATTSGMGTGAGFFNSLVRYLSEALGSDVAMIGKLGGAKLDHVNTVAVYQDGAPRSNFQYDLARTPCENVVEGTTCVYPRKAAELFPMDHMLVKLGIESYIGSPLFDSTGKPIGIIAALSRGMISDVSNAEHLLTIFASRAAAELELRDKIEALSASEQRFKDFTEIAADIVWETDADLHLSYLNQQAFKRLALGSEDLLGRVPWELANPADACNVEWREFRNMLDGRRPFRDLVLALKDSHGMRRLMSVSGRPIFDQNERFLGYRGIATEITEQRRIEAEYRDIFNNASEGIYRSSPEGRFLRVNPALVRLQGFETEAELMESMSDRATDWFVNPEDRTRLIDRLNKEGRVDDFEFQIYRRDTGEKIWVRESAHVVCDDSGDVAYYEGMVYDITNEHKARERTLRRDTVLQMIARNAPIGEVLNEILRITETEGDHQTAVIFRKRDDLLYGTTMPELKTTCLETVDGKMPLEVGGAIHEALSGEREVVELCLEGDVDDGSDFVKTMREAGYGEGLAAPIRDQKGVVLGLLAVFGAKGTVVGRTATTVLREAAHIASIAIEQDRLSEELRSQAHFEPLTGLPNRTLLADRLDQALRDANRGKYSVAVLVLDLDEFKRVNDTLGHSVGDELLQEVAARLRDCLRSGDTVARLGGDEFVVVLPLKKGVAYCTDVAERLLQALRAEIRTSETRVSAHASIGIGLYPQDGETPDSLLQAADAAMYAAKKAGKNGYRYYSESMNRQAAGQTKNESDLYRGLENENLDLYYQPRVTLDGGELCGAEALLRWDHPERGLLDAKEFVGIAERRSLMSRIGDFVSHRAVEQLAAWQRDGFSTVLSMNVSARELHGSNFIAQVARMLEEAGVDASGLEIEISESILSSDYERTCYQLLELKKCIPGLRIAIDNFGTYNSSLDHLRRVPIDTLKLDRFLIAELDDPEGAKIGAITQALAELGQRLGFVVVAVGLEHETQAQLLQKYGCHQAQGFLYAPALSLEEFEKRFKSSKSQRT